MRSLFTAIAIIFVFSANGLYSQAQGMTQQFGVPLKAEGVSDYKIDVISAPVDSFNNVEDQKSEKPDDKSGNILLNEEDWIIADSLKFNMMIKGGKNFGVSIDYDNKKFNVINGPELTEAAKQAIDRTPAWFRLQLEYTLSQLGEDDQNSLAEVINTAEDPYFDEIAFAIAHLSPKYLRSDYCYPQLFVENANLIYSRDEDLAYVEIVDHGSSADDDYYTTVKYKKINGQGQEEEITVPKEIYYWYIVHPKLSDEIPSYINPNLVEYNLDNNGPRTKNIQDPPDGVFWRNWLYTITEPDLDSNEINYPVLKDEVTQAQYLFDDSDHENLSAVRQIHFWVRRVMNFTSKQERPHQPVRIYKLHIGRCGEHEDLTNAAARTCLIPCRGANAPSQDHVWNEFWDEGWWQWEPVMKTGMKRDSAYGEAGWGRHMGSVYARRSDGWIFPVTKRYTPHTSDIELTIVDKNSEPIDGARVIIYARNEKYAPNILFDTYASTDNNGKVKFEVGRFNDYFVKVISSYGNVPAEQNKVATIVEAAEEGQRYTATIKMPQAIRLREHTINTDIEDNKEDFRLEANLESVGGYYNFPVLLDDMSVNYVTNDMGGASFDYMLIDYDNYLLFNGGHDAELYSLENNILEVENTFNVPSQKDWYALIHNDRDENMVRVRGEFKLYFNPLSSVEEDKVLKEKLKCVPNPFCCSTDINFNLDKASSAEISVFNVTGEKVRTFEKTNYSEGYHKLFWDGTDDSGKNLPDGVYYLNIETDYDSEMIQIVIMR